MATNLLAQKYQVTSLFDVDVGRCKEFGCKVAKNPREITEENDIIITGSNPGPGLLCNEC